jgi:hypothetical protein
MGKWLVLDTIPLLHEPHWLGLFSAAHHGPWPGYPSRPALTYVVPRLLLTVCHAAP